VRQICGRYWQFSVRASDRQGAFDWGQAVGDGAPFTGVNDLPSAWRDGRVSDYSDRAAPLLM